MHVVEGVLLNLGRVLVAEARQGAAGEWQCVGDGRLGIDTQDGDLVLRVQVVVDTADVLVCRGNGDRVEDVAVGAAIGSRDVLLHQVRRDGVEGAGWDMAVEAVRQPAQVFVPLGTQAAFALESAVMLAGIGFAAKLEMCSRAASVEVGGEVAAELRGGEDVGAAAASRNALTCSLVGDQKKKSLSRKIGAPMVPPKMFWWYGRDDRLGRRSGRGDCVVEEVGRVQEGVAVELEGVAMEVVRALLDGRADDAAGVAVVLGVQRAVDQVELIDGVEVRGVDESVERDVVGVRAVDEKLTLLRLTTADGGACRSGRWRPERRARSARGR